MVLKVHCDICGADKPAFTDNTTISVTVSTKTIATVIHVTPDMCTDCFDKALKELGKILRNMT